MLVELIKSIESTAKVICQQKKIAITDKDTLAPLIEKLKTNGFFDGNFQNQFDSIKGTLTNLLKSLGSNRNEEGVGHGAGSKNVEISDHLARYCLNMTASAILFLLETFNQT